MAWLPGQSNTPSIQPNPHLPSPPPVSSLPPQHNQAKSSSPLPPPPPRSRLFLSLSRQAATPPSPSADPRRVLFLRPAAAAAVVGASPCHFIQVIHPSIHQFPCFHVVLLYSLIPSAVLLPMIDSSGGGKKKKDHLFFYRSLCAILISLVWRISWADAHRALSICRF